MEFTSATQPTMYFIGVTTTKSSIMKVFPLWAEELGLKDAVIKGIDIEIHADPQKYRDTVEFIKNDKLSLGALVTTHKLDLYNAARRSFEYLDTYAEMFEELSSISKKDGRLEGYAKDPISSGLAMENFIPENFWKEHGGEVLIMGAGGSALAISSYLMKKEHGDNIPSKIIITNRSRERLDSAKAKLDGMHPGVKLEYYLCPEAKDNDEVMKNMKPYSLIINATGLGKDRPGSPLTDGCLFPENSLVWELNYRGDLKFMVQAGEQKEKRNLFIEDGWIYFIHGWTQVISEVFHVDIKGEKLERLEKLANSLR
ncbi:shikimate dehydrogenase family protein [Ruminiclostridium cellobioparum]|uniref:shikimate dehydrogenase family protein n=1 Tax=Ruminiclostridium cellobioparum TaxID=29355 RepID=UPI000480B4E8|nr:shikimate dehydrogenase [Ruminiclostridium cellobioparum]